MNSIELADELIARLNKLIEDPAVRDDIGRLVEARIECSNQTAEHPTIQAQTEAGRAVVGFLGVLNGLVGTIPTGKLTGYGYIAAYVDDDNKLVRFERTDNGQ
jgi:hypothetical protein